MYLEIYIDVLILINLIMDSFLLAVTNIILKKRARLFRIISGGAVGALTGSIPVIFINLPVFIKWIIAYPMSCIIMILTAFGYRGLKSLMKSTAVLVITAFLFSGALNNIYSNTFMGYYIIEFLTRRNNIYKMWSILLFSAVITALSYISVKLIRYFKAGASNFYETELILNDKSIKLIGLYDTGNGLTDPVTGNEVVIAEYEYIKKLIPDDWKEYIEAFHEGRNYEFMEGKDSLRMKLIPFSSIGKENGLLLGIVFDEIKIYKNESSYMEFDNIKDIIVGIYMGKVSSNNKYHLILHKDFK